MTNLSPAVCQKIKEARLEAGLSQSALAKEVGCKQSAISMFEQGDGTKLNDEVIKRLAEKFNIDLKPKPIEPVRTELEVKAAYLTPSSTRGFCPNPSCPSNHVYAVQGKTFYRPNLSEADPVYGKFCALCGEVLEKTCPNCGRSVHEGAFCSWCSAPYVSSC